jgi:hypothetical protein
LRSDFDKIFNDLPMAVSNQRLRIRYKGTSQLVVYIYVQEQP